MKLENLRSEAYLWLVTGGLAVLIAASPYVGPRQSEKAPAAREIPCIVPEPYEIRHTYTAEVDFRPVSRRQVEKALELIRSLEGDENLRCPEDHAIFRLLGEYKEGDRHYRLSRKVFVNRYDPASPLIGRMAFVCHGHEYAVNPAIRSSTAMLALALYHELMHGVQCVEGRLQNELTADPCAQEAEAFAAQVRFFVALEKRNMLPTGMSVAEPGDVGLVMQTLQAWKSLARGKKQFCKWYRRSVACLAR